MNILFVAGEFDIAPRPSGYAKKLFLHLLENLRDLQQVNFINGGLYHELYYCLNQPPVGSPYDVIVWMPRVANDRPKLISLVKDVYPHALLVMSKRNDDDKYSHLHLAARMLQAKANLMLEMKVPKEHFQTRILDPLGNEFGLAGGHDPEKIEDVASVLAKRLTQLMNVTRVGSHTFTDPNVNYSGQVPDQPEFFLLAQQYAETFHDLIHCDDDNTRFMGNLSFRCENGFPSFRQHDLIFVSRRNVDKRDIGREGMVPVVAQSPNGVRFLGQERPSVDTPIQLLLYQHYRQIKYMLHAHVYVRGAPMTNSVLPCGAIEEAQEIIDVFPDPNIQSFRINLRGHGSLVAASNIDQMRDMPYMSRGLPEFHVI